MQPLLSISVSSTINSPIFLQKADALAKKLDLPCAGPTSHCLTEMTLAYTPQGLQLLQLLPGDKRPKTLLYVDLVHGKNGYRLANDCTIKQPLARAVGIRSGFRPKILDGTGGLGGDSFVLASLGCQVTICERSPLIAALLEDGLQRAAQEGRTVEIARRLQLVACDTKSFLTQCNDVFSTIYLDPMYPTSQESALNRQSMRIIRTLVGDDQDSGLLLAASIKNAGNRVVVKRPRMASILTEQHPSHSLVMKSCRFDVYLTCSHREA